MAETVELSVVLPAYLEEENLRLLLPRIRDELEAVGLSYEVIVVDTPKPLDSTEDACHRNGATYVNRGPTDCFGDAVRTGIGRARGKWLVFMDADGSHTPEFLHRLLAERISSDIVIASRYVKGGFTENPTHLIWMSRILNISYSLILGLKCKDVSNSFKLYRADLLKGLTLRCNNFDIIEEILYKVSRLHPAVRIKEIPFSFKKRMFGDTKRNLLLFIFTYVYTIFKLRLSSIR